MDRLVLTFSGHIYLRPPFWLPLLYYFAKLALLFNRQALRIILSIEEPG